METGLTNENTGILKKFALIVAGGSGSRMCHDVPKQFLVIAGKPLLMHTLESFLAFDPQMEIIVVLPEGKTEHWKKLCQVHQCTIAHHVTCGGMERFFSVRNGLNLISGEGIVFIHDGVRPLVSRETLLRCFDTALQYGNALPVVSVSESVRYIDQESSQSLDRSKVMLVQTPQTFLVSLIKDAYQQPYDQQFTDDASVLEKFGHKIHLTGGNRENIKITWPSDLPWAEALLGNRNPDVTGKY